ncbi:MAG TPA: VIT domain-containing protein [Kofleriaceae bacterium]|nr:VIT domain-containing protein [Kofleriaceae bacterium]
MRLALAPILMLALATRVASAGSSRVPGPGMYVAKTATALPLVDSKVDVQVRGPIAEITVAQTFRNDDAAPTEATYIFPLPSDAAVTGMAIDAGARTIRAAIERRAQAQARYEDAIAKGLDAGMLEQERPDIFTQSVAAIPPHATVTVRLRFDTAARFSNGTWQLVLPLVVAPRYVPGSASGKPTVGAGRSPDTDRAPDASRVTPAATPGGGGATEISIEFASGVSDVASPTHELDKRGDRYVIASATSDRDAVVRWRASQPAQGWVESDGFAAVVVEGAPLPASHAPIRATLVLDRAATTLGDGELARHAFETAFASALTNADRVATENGQLGPPDALRAQLANAPAHAKFDLTRVLKKLAPAGAPIVLVTDGLVADDAAAIAAARSLRVPIHVIGFGPAPNRSLLDAIAATTGGTVRVAVVGDDFPALAAGVLADIASPPAPFAVTWGTLAASAIVPALQPRLGAGQAAVVFARVASPKAANARANGAVIALAALSTPSAPAGATTQHGPIARMWARRELDELVARGDPKAIADHALAFGLVSPETSMVAVGTEVTTVGGVRHTRSVPVSLPAGMRWQDVQTETTVETKPAADVSAHVTTTTTPSPAPPPVQPAPATTEAPPENKNAAKKRPTVDKGAAEETDGGEDDDNDANTHAHRKHHHEADESEDDTAKPAAGASASAENITNIFGSDSVEAMSLTGAVSERRRLRFAAALEGGISVAHAATVGMGALALRADYGRETRVGGEASLWLVDGFHAQGLVGLYVGEVFGHLELDIGADAHFGGGIGPSLAVALRYYVARHVDIGIREDLGVLFDSGTHFVDSTTSAGLELSW